jgi:hypothetical protein
MTTTPGAAAPLPLKGAPPADRQSRIRGVHWTNASERNEY